MSRTGRSRARQKGVAIVTAVTVAALVAALAFALANRTRLWINQVQNRQDAMHAQSIAFSAIDLARLVLRDDARNSQLDHLQESWAMPIPAMGVESGRVAGRILDLQGRFNLSNLVRNGRLDAASLAGFQHLLIAIGQAPELAASLESVLTKELTARDEAKIERVFPYVDLVDLAVVPGFSATVLAQLEPWVCVLPERSRLNINFASPEVLAAVSSGLSVGEAGSILGGRSGSYFNSVLAFRKGLSETQRSKLDNDDLTVQSHYFLVETQAWFGRVHLRYRALLSRSGNAMPSVVWVRRSYGFE